MKIGIITYHRAINYGAVLQAYSLKTYLGDLGNMVEIINYYNVDKKSKIHSKKEKLISTIWSPFCKILGKAKKEKKFIHFQNDYLNRNNILIKNDIELCKYVDENKIDCLVSGSDQVWNPNINGRDPSFYFGFDTKAKKMSYAASFGASSLKENDSLEIAGYLKDFSFISVREKTGQTIIDNMNSNIKTYVVVDPVFLHNFDFWSNFAGQRLFKKKYVFCYVMPGDKEVEKKIEKLAKQYKKGTSAKIIFVGRKEYKRLKPDGKDFISASPREFVNLICYADFVITNSFHGTAFSTLLNKNFYSINSGNKNSSKRYGSRINDFLESIGLNERILEKDSNPDFSKINYELVNKKLHSWIQESKDLLEESIKE